MSYSSVILADAPKAWYRMQEVSGLIQDSSGNAMNANTSTGTATYGQASPITSDATAKSILFGNAQNFQVPDNNTIDFADVFTVEAWIKRTTTNPVTGETWVDRGSGAFKIFIEGTQAPASAQKVVLTKPGTGDSLVSSVTIAETANWHYIVVTKNGATNKVYFNAVEDTGATVTNQTCASTATALFVGSSRNADDFLNSYCTELALYSTALTQTQITAHYNAATTTNIATGTSWLRT